MPGPVLQLPTHKAREYQRRFYAYMEGGGRRAALLWHRRCVAHDSKIIMADGSWRPISEVKAGDLIASWDGRRIVADRVKDIWPTGPKVVHEVGVSGLPTCWATDDHKFAGTWPTHDAVSFLPLAELREKRRMLMALGPQPVELEVGTFSNVQLAELVGYLVTDGSVHESQSPKFTNTNEALCWRVAELCPILEATARWRRKGKGWDVQLSNGTAGGGETKNPVKEWFREQGALGKGAERRLPRQVWEYAWPAIFAFFGAVIDGDGCIYVQKRGRRITDAIRGVRPEIRPAAEVRIAVGLSEAQAWDYHWLLRKIGVRSQVRRDKRPAHCRTWMVRVQEQESVHTLLSGLRTISKEPQREAALAASEREGSRAVRMGCFVGAPKFTGASRVAETFDLETEQRHCFFADGYLVHNSGKDDCAASWTSIAALESKPAVYWHMLPEYTQARKALWTAVNPHTGLKRIDEWFPPAMRKTTREQQMEIEFINGALWQAVGSDSFDRLVGASVKGVVFSEFALAKPEAWAYVSPILAENDGWAIFPSTPRGRNHWHDLYQTAERDPDWFAQKLTAHETGVFTPEALEKERRTLQDTYGFDDGDAKFRQEYECDWWAANAGAYYTREFTEIDKDRRITDVPHDPGLPVWTSWDLGRGDQTAIWFIQLRGMQVRVIDYYCASGVGIDHYAKIVRAKPYVYEKHLFPHDAEATSIDVPTGKTRLDVIKQLGISPVKVLPRDDVEDGINAARRLLTRCWFDKEKTRDGVEALRAYQRQWNEDRKVFMPTPYHNWASDPADAFRYLAMGLPEKLTVSDPARGDRYRADRRSSAPSRWAI